MRFFSGCCRLLAAAVVIVVAADFTSIGSHVDV